MSKAYEVAENWSPPSRNEDPGLQSFARRCFIDGYESAENQQEPETPIMPSEREACVALAYIIRDAARKARDSGLQSDDDELDRLVRVFNYPPKDLIDAVVRYAGPTRRPAKAFPEGLMMGFKSPRET